MMSSSTCSTCEHLEVTPRINGSDSYFVIFYDPWQSTDLDDRFGQIREQVGQATDAVVENVKNLAIHLLKLGSELAHGQLHARLRADNPQQLVHETSDLGGVRQRDEAPRAVADYLDNVRERVEQVDELGEAVVGDTALATKVVVVGRDELAKREHAAGAGAEEVDNLAGEHVDLGLERVHWARQSVRRRIACN